MGSGTTAVVSKKLDRHFVGIELNPAYVAMSHRRLEKEVGLLFAS
jgi:DNA modification methylase